MSLGISVAQERRTFIQEAMFSARRLLGHFVPSSSLNSRDCGILVVVLVPIGQTTRNESSFRNSSVVLVHSRLEVLDFFLEFGSSLRFLLFQSFLSFVRSTVLATIEGYPITVDGDASVVTNELQILDSGGLLVRVPPRLREPSLNEVL
jgi:hypothetical protein